MSTTFKLRVLEADGVFYEGDCVSLVLPMFDGKYGIMANHYNTIGAVVPGEMTIRKTDGSVEVAAVASGIFKIEDNTVLVLVETAESPEEIDRNRAKKAEIAAREQLLLKRSEQEFHEAQTRLARAVSRLKVHDRYESHRGNL